MKKNKDIAVGNVKPDISRNLPSSDPLANVIYDPYIIDEVDEDAVFIGESFSEDFSDISDNPPTTDGPSIPEFPCLDTAEVIGHEVTGAFRGFVYRPEVTLLIKEVKGATDYAVRIRKLP